mmetsp:Transcript_10868/g.38129  ORF Transcript_10868/g.38129 Transcript_10868/m.38129 type:complete len:308 (+) Transcript_10868:679-1602(+)
MRSRIFRMRSVNGVAPRGTVLLSSFSSCMIEPSTSPREASIRMQSRPSSKAPPAAGGFSSTNSTGVPMLAFQRACSRAMWVISSHLVHLWNLGCWPPSSMSTLPSGCAVEPELSSRKTRRAILRSSSLTSLARPAGKPSCISRSTPSPSGAAVSRSREPSNCRSGETCVADADAGPVPASATAGEGCAAGAAAGPWAHSEGGRTEETAEAPKPASLSSAASAKFGRTDCGLKKRRQVGQRSGFSGAMQRLQKVCAQSPSICGSAISLCARLPECVDADGAHQEIPRLLHHDGRKLEAQPRQQPCGSK